MKKLLLPALLLAGAASYANAEEVVLFSEDFNWIERWVTEGLKAADASACTAVDNFALEGAEAYTTGTPRTDDIYVLDEEKGDTEGKYFLRSAIQGKERNYWCVGYDKNGNQENQYMGADSYYFGKNWLKFGKTNAQANFRFQPADGQAEDFVKPIGTPATLTFNWAPWAACPKGEDGNYYIGDMDEVTLDIIVDSEVVEQVTHNLPAGTPLAWLEASIDLTDFEITPKTRIFIQPTAEYWAVAKSGKHRWALDNIKVVYGEAEGGNEGEGNVWYSEDFNKMFEPWYDLLSLTDPVGTNDTTGDLGVALTDDTKAADGRRMKHAFMDQTLVTAADENHFCSNNGFLCWILDGKVHASYYVYRVHKGYIRFGVDNILGGVCLPSVTIPEDAENVYFEFDWCPTKNANGEYSEAVLQVAQQDEAAIFIPEIRHNMQTGDPYAWKHECFSLYDDCDNFTPNTLRFLISTSKAAGLGWPEGDGKKVDGSFYLDNIRISDKASSGVNNIAVENNSNAPVEYFNLQGVRVANPENGLYIRRQGNTATKVFIR